MKSKKFFGILASIILTLPILASCGTNKGDGGNVSIPESIPNSIPGVVNDVEKQIRDIYELAVKSGYTGTYEEWLASIKGEAGVGIQDIKIGDVDKNGILKVTIVLTNGVTKTFEIDLSNLKGEGSGQNGKSAYELFVENFGYVGSETEWLTDLANHTLGTEREYTVCVKFVHPGEVDDFGDILMTDVIPARKYKNGERVEFEIPELGGKYKFLGVCDNFEDPNSYFPNVVDHENYRAHKNATLYICFESFEYQLLNEDGKNYFTQTNYKEPIYARLTNVGNAGTNEIVTGAELNRFSFKITHLDTANAVIDYSLETGILKADRACSFTLEIYLDGKLIISNGFMFIGEQQEVEILISDKTRQVLDNAMVGVELRIYGSLIYPNGREENIEEAFISDRLELIVSPAENMNATSEYSFVPLKPGKMTVMIFDYATQSQVFNYAFEVKPAEKPEPGVTSKIKISTPNNMTEFMANEPIQLGFYDPNLAIAIDARKVAFVVAYPDGSKYFNYKFDVDSMILIIPEAGEYLLRAKYNSSETETKITIIDKNPNPHPDPDPNPDPVVPDKPEPIEVKSLSAITERVDNPLSYLYFLKVKVSGFMKDSLTDIGELIVSDLNDTNATNAYLCSTSMNSIEWNADKGQFYFKSDHNILKNPVTNQIKIGDVLTVYAIRRDIKTEHQVALVISEVNNIKVPETKPEPPVKINGIYIAPDVIPGAMENGTHGPMTFDKVSLGDSKCVINFQDISIKKSGPNTAIELSEKYLSSIYNVTPTDKDIKAIEINYASWRSKPGIPVDPLSVAIGDKSFGAGAKGNILVTEPDKFTYYVEAPAAGQRFFQISIPERYAYIESISILYV